MKNNISIELNEKQDEAVKHTEGYLRVIAGAGSGKTKLLVSRFAYLVKEVGIDTTNILCVTFTNKAAMEMKRRIVSIIGDGYDTNLICTYHGFCARVLREDIEKVFYPKSFQIIDKGMQKSILTEIYQKYELKLDYASFEKILQDINKFKAKRGYVEKMCDRGNVQILPSVTTLQDKIIEDYLQNEKNTFGMDFNDLIYFTLYMFNKCPEVLKKWQERLNYIQVDEFQDSSSVEMELIDLLSGKYKNLMIVGDPDQNIYEWRGSDVRLLVDFDKTHNMTKTVFLNQNYRSTKAILKVANTLIDNNKLRVKKDLFTTNDDEIQVVHLHTKNEQEEAKKIVEKINELHEKEKVKFSNFTVLYRSSYLSRIIEKSFTENGIPYEIFGGVKFYQRMEIQDILAYLRLIVFDDDLSLKRIINTPKRQFGRVRLEKLVKMQEEGENLFETLIRCKDELCAGNDVIDSFIENIKQLRINKNNLKISDVISQICDKSGYEKYIRELGDMERFENLSEFKRIASEFEKSYGENVSLEEFINQISIQSNEDEEKDEDQVKLMTIHASKGLEFENVFIIGMSEGIFPSSKTIEERKELGLEEERRLCYVALTRAKKRLFVTDSEGFNQNGKQKLPSRFLYEMGSENYIRQGVISKELENARKKYVEDEGKENISLFEKFTVGDRINHKIYGEGTIVKDYKKENKYQIKFDKLELPRDISKKYFYDNDDSINFKVKDNNIVNNNANVKQFKENDKIIINDLDKIDWDDNYEKKQLEQKKNVKKEKPELSEYSNLWDDPNVPKKGWTCTGVTDLGGPYGVCEMCGKQIIRYVHHMIHPHYRSLGVGCVCAGNMEGDVEGAKTREENYKNNLKKLDTFLKKKWKNTRNDNRYLKYKEHFLLLFYDYDRKKFKYSIDQIFGKDEYDTAREAKIGVFKALMDNIT